MSQPVSKVVASTYFLCGWLLLFITLLPQTALAKHNAHHHQARNSIIVGSELDYPPFALINEKGEADGFSVDLFKAVANTMNIRVSFRVGPWSEVRAALENGEIDALPLVGYTEQRDKHFDFSLPHTVSYGAIFKRKGEKDINKLDDLHGSSIVAMLADNTHDYIIKHQLSDNIIGKSTVKDVLKALSSGQGDYAVLPRLVALVMSNELGIDNLEITGPLLDAYGPGFSFAVHEGDALLLAALNQGLNVVRASGEYDQICDKWFGDVAPREQHSKSLVRYVLIVGLAAGLILILGLVWNLMLRRQVALRTKALRQSELRFASTFAETAIGMAHVAPDGSWLRVNQALCDIVGYSEDELLKISFQDITHPDDLDADLHFVEQMLAGEIETYAMEKRYIRKDRTIIWINLTVSLVKREQGEADYFISVVEDISSRKQLEHMLVLERNQAQQYLETANVMMVALDNHGCITLINSKGLEILGYNEDELIGKDWFDTCLHEENIADVRTVFDLIIKGDIEAVEYYENPVLTKSGQQRTIAFHNSLLTDADGHIFGLLSSGEDITERIKAEQTINALVETTSRTLGTEFFNSSVTNLQRWLDADVVIIGELLNQKRVRSVAMRLDDAFIEQYTYDLKGTPCENVVEHGFCSYPENAQILFPLDEDLVKLHIEGYIGEPLKDRQGNSIGVICALSRTKHHFPEHAEDVMKIVAARAASELERRNAESRLNKFSRAIEQAGEAVVITDADGTIEYLNQAFTRITGYAPEEAIGKNPRILKSGKHDDQFYEAMWQRLTSGKVWQGRMVDKRKDGSLYPALVTISPLKSESGEISNYVGVQQSLKKVEELERQFYQSQKMEAIGTLVGGIAHDFNNSLAGIAGNLYLARVKTDHPEVLAKIESCEKLAFSAAAMIQQLLAFSRKGVVNMSTITIDSFLKEAIKLNRLSIPESVEISQRIEHSGLKVRGDINQLQQVMMNLLNNARDALEGRDSPRIDIKLTRERVQDESSGSSAEVKPGEYACITVEDNGCGITPEQKAHLFEPFYTTKEAGKGTGLGLAMVYGAVKTHGGWIYANPGAEGVGTAMTIYLPLVESGAEQPVEAVTDAVVEGSGELILLVDDNQMVLEVGEEVLRGLNYRVMTATDGHQAVERYREHQQEIGLLILDIEMPKMGGMEALKAIREINPDVKAIFATGYNKASAISGHDEFKAEVVISKPFAVSELSQLIRKQMDHFQ